MRIHMHIQYQDQGGRVVTVDDAQKWDRFAAMADNSVGMGKEPTMDVYIRHWQYTEPQLFILRTGNEGKEDAAQKPAAPNEWTSGLLSCTAGGLPTCVKGCVCPCLLSAELVAALGGSWWSGCVTGLGGSTCLYRQRVRMLYGIPASAAQDCRASLCCGPCSLCQLVTHVRRHKPTTNSGANPWPVGLCAVRTPGFCRRWCFTACCTSCALGEIRSRLGAEEAPPVPCSSTAGCCRSVCLLSLVCCGGCLTMQSRTITRAMLGIQDSKYPCLTDLAAALCCTSCALVQVAAALDLWFPRLHHAY